MGGTTARCDHCVMIAVVSDKGGVGKTTSATSVAHGLALGSLGPPARVLLVDFDLLGQDAIVLGLPPERGLYDYLVRRAPAQQVVRKTGRVGLQLLPGNGWTRQADNLLRNEPLDELVARLRALSRGYDYLVIDTHPSGLLQELAIRVADVVIAPVRLEALAMDGVAATLQLVHDVGRPRQVILLPTMVDERLSAQRYHLNLLREAYPGQVAEPIPLRAAVAEGHGAGQTVWEQRGRKAQLASVRSAYAQVVAWLSTPADEVLFGPEVLR